MPSDSRLGSLQAHRPWHLFRQFIAAICIVAIAGVAFSRGSGREVASLLGRSPDSLAPRIDGIPCQATEQGIYHVHAHLTVLVNGAPMEIPAGIGIVEPSTTLPDGSIEGGMCLYWLHTHDASGTIHVEAPAPQAFTIGQFFDVRGQPLTNTSAAGYQGVITASIDGTPYTGDVRSIPLAEGTQITFVVGKATVPPSP